MQNNNQKRRWRDIPKAVRVAIISASVAEMGLIVAAQVDISRRPVDQIRGGKLRWRLVALINFVGPILYFGRGRIKKRA